MRLGEAGTSPQHRIKSYIHHMTEPSISDNRALKVAEAYPGRSTASQRVYRCKLPEYWGNRKKIPGIKWPGAPVNDEPVRQGRANKQRAQAIETNE